MRLQQSEEVSLFTMKQYSWSIDTITCVCAEALCLSTNANAHNLSSQVLEQELQQVQELEQVHVLVQERVQEQHRFQPNDKINRRRSSFDAESPRSSIVAFRPPCHRRPFVFIFFFIAGSFHQQPVPV